MISNLRQNGIELFHQQLNYYSLRFYATGNMLISVGDFAGVSKTSACSIVRQVSEAIARLRPRNIRFPENIATRQKAKENFYRVARFPLVIGAIDCTHVKIQSPGGEDAERFRNRKGYFSWNVQTICDAQLKIIDIVARWPGSCHDQTIFNNSRIKSRFSNGEFPNCVILGDSGYGNTNYLLTPLSDPFTAAEKLYNESHIRTRNCVERSYGVWKRRFSILSLGMRVNAELSKIIIVATAVLHNICIEEKDGDPPIELDLENLVITALFLFPKVPRLSPAFLVSGFVSLYHNCLYNCLCNKVTCMKY
ncbi:hypothetical protein YQE_00541, partial [Dendroctonus ponderosae]